jgi:single-stranded-DNA-specific exonuclease
MMPTPATLVAPASRWAPRGDHADAGIVAALQDALKLPTSLCQLLARRGYTDADAAKLFLKPRLDRLLDPYGLAGMREAVDRLDRAIRAGETILVHGDYDVDGVCSAAMFTRVLRHLGGRVEPFVPHRMRDGYDLSQAGVRAAAEVGATVILTGDCGVVAHDAVTAARNMGIDVIVTDHHTPSDTLPDAVAVVNPNRPDCSYENKALCGAGVAFKLCQAMWSSRNFDQEELRYYLDLVAVATIADLAPLTGENRVIAHYGLRVLSQSRNPGMRALLHSAGLSGLERVAAGQVSHVLAPRINAVGRMSAATKGVRLLLEDDASLAHGLADILESENRTRQEVDRQTLAQALQLLEQDYDPARDYTIVLGGEGWHPGVIGIVASRVVERLHRPTILFALDPKTALARGSARSIPGFHLYDALKECAHYLERFGGHKYAAGMDIKPERIPEFREAFNAIARERLSPEDLIPVLGYDLELDVTEASLQLTRLLRHFGPFGVGNPSPVLISRNVRVVNMREVGEGHVKFEIQENGTRLGVIGFGMAERARDLDVANQPIDIAYQLQENYWNGEVELQARLIDLRPAG